MEVIIRDLVSGRVLYHDSNFSVKSLNGVAGGSDIEQDVWDVALSMGLVSPEQRANCAIEVDDEC